MGHGPKAKCLKIPARTRSPATNPPAPPPPRRGRLDSGCDDHVHVHHDLPRSPEPRDWAALPRDVLWVILSLVPQADILHGAGLACASWRRLALDEPLLWRRIDLVTDKDEDGPPAGWLAMACAAVRRSAGRCESFRGRVNPDFLLFLANSAPSLRSLHVTSRFYHMPGAEFATALAKKLAMLEQLVLSGGQIDEAFWTALANHCPRLQLLHADGCCIWYPLGGTLRASMESRIKDPRLPHMAPSCRRGPRLLLGVHAPRTGRLRELPKPDGL
ncbi:hypothetical protein ACQ4PT_008875 [Festuca glaucescens]